MMRFKTGSGWRCCYDPETGLYTAEIGGGPNHDLYEITKEIFDRVDDPDVKWPTRLIHEGRHLYMAVDDRCGPPYTVILDTDYQKLCPWAKTELSGTVWDEDLTDAAVEVFASEAKNRPQRRAKKAAREKQHAEEATTQTERETALSARGTMRENVLPMKNRREFRQWLQIHASEETECWITVKRGKPTDSDVFYYLDAVEEALCFGWIDSTQAVIEGVRMQRFTPRRKNSNWTELNKERVRRLEKLGLMTDAGRAVLPAMGPRSFRIDPDLEAALKQARVWSRFKSFPALYQRVRAGNLAFYKRRNPTAYEQMLSRLIAETKKGRMFGEWNDYGRLLEDEGSPESFLTQEEAT